MPASLRAYAATLAAFLLLDAIWLTQVAAPIYRQALGPLMLHQPRLDGVLAFYVLQILGMMVFILPRLQPGPGQAGPGLARAAWLGGLYGFFTYSTFDLTNYATLQAWTLWLVITDIAWGSVLSAAAMTAGAWAFGRAGNGSSAAR